MIVGIRRSIHSPPRRRADKTRRPKEEVERLALEAAREVRAKECAIKPLRQEVEARQARQDAASWRVKTQQPGAYGELVVARKSLREKRTGLLHEEQELKRLRQEWYRLNKMSEAAGKMRRSSITGSSQETATSSAPSMTTPTPDRPIVEDSSKHLDISQLQVPAGHVLVWSETDYGISKMSETVALSYAGIQNHLNRFQTLQGQLDRQAQEQTAGQAPVQGQAKGQAPVQGQAKGQAPVQEQAEGQARDQAQGGLTRRELLEAIKMPRSHKITAQLLDCISHTRKLVKFRQRALRMPVNASVSEALKRISTKEASLKNAATLEHVDRAFAIQKRNRSVLREFEYSCSLQKQRHNQELRSTRAWDVVAAEERRYVRQVGQDQSSTASAPSSARLDPDGWCMECCRHHLPVVENNVMRTRQVCPRHYPQVITVMIIGDKGTGVGSRIGGHSRRGGTRMRRNHRRYCTVAIHDEFRTSKICTYCHGAVILARSRRVKNGQVIFKTVNGTVECSNPACVSFRCGYTMKARDPHSAVAILMSAW
ncbi:unnamed protein product [Mortierella alpina]